MAEVDVEDELVSSIPLLQRKREETCYSRQYHVISRFVLFGDKRREVGAVISHYVSNIVPTRYSGPLHKSNIALIRYLLLT